VIDVVRYDEDGVKRELGTARAFGAEEDDRAAGEIAQLGRAVLRVLEAAGVVEAIAEDERVGVVETAVRGLVGPEGTMSPERLVVARSPWSLASSARARCDGSHCTCNAIASDY
jgi:hypothetical protein